MRELQAMMAATQAVRSHPRLQKYSQEDPEYLQKLVSLIGQIQANPNNLRLIMAQPVSLPAAKDRMREDKRGVTKPAGRFLCIVLSLNTTNSGVK